MKKCPGFFIMCSSVTAGAVKAGKDSKKAKIRSVSRPMFSQVYLEEEGSGAETVDVTKFQNFWLTLIVVGAYTATAIAAIGKITDPATLNALPGFDGTMITLLGISHAGYIAGKLPDKK